MTARLLICVLLIERAFGGSAPEYSKKVNTGSSTKINLKDLKIFKSYKMPNLDPNANNLHKAVWFGNAEFVSDLIINKKMNVNQRDIGQSTPLHVAVMNSDLEMVELLINLNAGLDSRTTWTEKFVQKLIKNGYEGVYDTMEIRKKVSSMPSTNTSLHIAFMIGHQPIIAALIEANAKLTKENIQLYTPLHIAIKHHNEDMLGELIDSKLIDVNTGGIYRDGPGLLEFASQHGNVRAVYTLIKSKAKLNSKMNGQFTGMSPIQYASKHGHNEVVKVLLSHNATIKPISSNGAFRDSAMVLASKYGHKDVLLTLLSSKQASAINQRDPCRQTCLHFAARNGFDQIVEALITKKADVNAKDWLCYTPLHLAAQNGDAVTVQKLLNAKANPAIESACHRETALDLARKFQMKTVEAMLSDTIPTQAPPVLFD